MAIAPGAHGQSAQDSTQSGVADSATRSQPASEVRFAVALQLSGSWCYGYLYGTQEQVRFEVIQPQSASRFSFALPRSEVAIHQWALLGMPQDAIELRARGATYHMRWLADAAEVNTGPARRWTPPTSKPPYALIAAMLDPAAQSAQNTKGAQGSSVGNQPSAVATSIGGSGFASEEITDVPPGMLAGIYVATAGADARPSNRQFLFYPDGMVMNGVPREGMLEFDFNHYRPRDNPTRNWVGRYQAAGVSHVPMQR